MGEVWCDCDSGDTAAVWVGADEGSQFARFALARVSGGVSDRLEKSERQIERWELGGGEEDLDRWATTRYRADGLEAGL